MLGHCLWRWPNIKTTVVQWPMFAGSLCAIIMLRSSKFGWTMITPRNVVLPFEAVIALAITASKERTILRCWPSINPTFGERLVIAGTCFVLYFQTHPDRKRNGWRQRLKHCLMCRCRIDCPCTRREQVHARAPRKHMSLTEVTLHALHFCKLL